MSHSHGNQNEGFASGNGPAAVQCLLQSDHPRLKMIASLLKNTVGHARNVVKGTDSQRRFNAQFSEFCCAAMVGLPDIQRQLDSGGSEGSVPTLRGNGSRRLNEVDFVKDISSYVAGEVKTLGLQYLEHIGTMAVSQKLERAEQQHLRQDRLWTEQQELNASTGESGYDGSGGAKSKASNKRKRRKSVTESSAGAPRQRAGRPRKQSEEAGSANDAPLVRTREKSLGGRTSDAERDSKPWSRTPPSASDATQRRRGASIVSPVVASHASEEAVADGNDLLPPSLHASTRQQRYSSRGGSVPYASEHRKRNESVSASGTKKNPSHHPHRRATAEKLSTQPDLTLRLQPWLIPQPCAHGIALDRVNIERSRVTWQAPFSSSSSSENASADSLQRGGILIPIMSQQNQYASRLSLRGISTRTAEGEEKAADQSVVDALNFVAPDRAGISTWDVCTAPTSVDMYHLWEVREAAVQSTNYLLQRAAAKASASQKDMSLKESQRARQGNKRSVQPTPASGTGEGGPAQASGGSAGSSGSSYAVPSMPPFVTSIASGTPVSGAADEDDDGIEKGNETAGGGYTTERASDGLPSFFPCKRKERKSVPSVSVGVPAPVMTSLVHFGISYCEPIYRRTRGL